MIVFGLDPAFRKSGWAICRMFRQGRKIRLHVERAGLVTTKPPGKKSNSLRANHDIEDCKKIARELAGFVEECGAYVICAETPLGSQSAVSAKCAGMVLACVACVS